MANQGCAPPILVRGLVAEVHPHATPPSMTLDSTFDNLGVGSLELAELLLRVQDKFGVALPPHILASAETPRDLVVAVARGHPAAGQDRGMVSLPATAPGAATAMLLKGGGSPTVEYAENDGRNNEAREGISNGRRPTVRPLHTAHQTGMALPDCASPRPSCDDRRRRSTYSCA
jgi:acyl carrier protein